MRDVRDDRLGPPRLVAVALVHLALGSDVVLEIGAAEVGVDVAQVAEYRVEMVVEDAVAGSAVRALKQAHPYEEPAWDLIALVTGEPG